MTDTRTVWDIALARGDWQLLGSQLLTGHDLETMAYICLFTDRTAKPDDVIPDGTDDPRGVWHNPELGSRIWLLLRSKQTQQTLSKARDFIIEALQPFKLSGLAARVDVFTEWSRPGFLGSLVNIYRSDGTLLLTKKYEWAWNQEKEI